MHTATGISEPKQTACFVSSTLCAEIFKSSKFMRQLLPSVPQHSVLPSWLNWRPTSEQIHVWSVTIDSLLYSALQISISPEKHKQHSLFALTPTKVHQFLLLQSQNFHIHEREKEKRKHLHKTASTELQGSFLLGVFFTMPLWSKQASSNESTTNFFPESKKQRRKGAISPGLFMTESLPSWLLGKCQSETFRCGFHQALSQDSNAAQF